jgi:hypothetical protein
VNPTTDSPAAAEKFKPSVGALIVIGALAPGRFTTTIGFDAYKAWIEGRINNETMAVIGFTG